jgi:hypothetical protein
MMKKSRNGRTDHMKASLFGTLLLLLCTFGCSNGTIYDAFPELEESGLHAVVFVTDINEEANHAYLDALLAIQHSSPIETHVATSSEHASEAGQFEITTYPCLILMEDQEVRLKIEGSYPLEIIEEKLHMEVNRFSKESWMRSIQKMDEA